MESPLPLRRWLVFNGVGAMGFVLQLAALGAMVHIGGLHYLVATVIAVEAAILHNYVWHLRWTWRDRPGRGVRNSLARLGRFHALNGAVSVGGNLVLMALLVGGAGIAPVEASAIAVLVCSLVNFAAADRFVFRAAAGSAAVLLLSPALHEPVTAAEPAAVLQAETQRAWRTYEQAVDRRYARLDASHVFFAHDEFQQQAWWRQSALGGAIPIFQTNGPQPGNAQPSVPDGRIHHWVGAMFIAGANLDSVLRDLRDRAGREAEAYDDVLASRLIGRNGDRLDVYMKLRRESVITVTYNTEHSVEYRRIGALRASSRSVATRIAELQDAGTDREREKLPGDDNGFLWRLNAYWRYEQTSGGVLIECESVSLSRSVPVLLRPLLNGTVDRIARQSLEKTLRSLRAALRS